MTSGANGDLTPVQCHAAKIVESLPSALRETHIAAMEKAVASINLALKFADERWLGSIATTARNRAKLLEEQASKARFAKWRDALGGRNPRTGARAPGRRAFNWVKAVTGWIPSRVGPSHCNDELPDDEQANEMVVHGDAAADACNHKHLQVWAGNCCAGCPLMNQAEVDAEGRTWADIWATQDKYEARFPASADDPIVPLTVDRLRQLGATTLRHVPLGASLTSL